MARNEFNESERVESNNETNKVADLGDLTQLGRSAERVGDNIEMTMEAIGKTVSDFADRISKLAGNSEHSGLMDSINYYAEKGEPLYVLIRDALKK